MAPLKSYKLFLAYQVPCRAVPPSSITFRQNLPPPPSLLVIFWLTFPSPQSDVTYRQNTYLPVFWNKLDRNGQIKKKGTKKSALRTDILADSQMKSYCFWLTHPPFTFGLTPPSITSDSLNGQTPLPHWSMFELSGQIFELWKALVPRHAGSCGSFLIQSLLSKCLKTLVKVTCCASLCKPRSDAY